MMSFFIAKEGSIAVSNDAGLLKLHGVSLIANAPYNSTVSWLQGSQKNMRVLSKRFYKLNLLVCEGGAPLQ